MYLEYVSAVISRIRRAVPPRIKPSASDRPYTKPEQPRLKSSAPIEVGSPSRSCIRQAVVGSG